MTQDTPTVEDMANELIDNQLPEHIISVSNAEEAKVVLIKALTEAHQAGIDEAVGEAMVREQQLRDIHKVELDTISCMSLEQFVVWSNQRKQHKDDTIKALQDNK